MESEIASPDRYGHTTDRRILLLFALFFGALITLMNDVLGWLNGGGLLSLVAANRAIAGHTPVILVDSAALRTCFGLASLGVVTLIAAAVRASPTTRLFGLAFAVGFFGGMFTLDTIFDSSIIERHMARNGYVRCRARDKEVGTGKSRVWLDAFVRDGSDCVPDGQKPVVAAIPPDPRTQLPRPARAVTIAGSWFGADAYPAEAVRAGLQGRVVVRFEVGVDGRVSSCTPTTSSGSAVLDAQTCAIVRANARYWPARDAAGVAVPAVDTTSVRWQLPTQ